MEFLREYCMEHGERRTFERGETLEEAGEPAQWVAFVERGCFKYMVYNYDEGMTIYPPPLKYLRGGGFERYLMTTFLSGKL